MFKLLSPEHLLKLSFANDSNSLDKTFYSELLHIIGLTETKEGSKKLIERKQEGQRYPGSLINYHKGDKSYIFLNLEKVHGYDDLNSLFFSVLARKQDERNETARQIFANVPYLNSSLFEPTKLEHDTIFISNLRDEKFPIFPATVLKNNNGKKRTGELDALQYLFEFLNAYDFSSEGSEDIRPLAKVPSDPPQPLLKRGEKTIYTRGLFKKITKR